MFTIDTLSAVRNVDIYAVISPRLQLKRQGSNYVGCCPLHGEKTPSFTVFLRTNTFKCFGCGKQGNAITFLMESEGLSFVEAVEAIAAEANIALETDLSFDREAYQQRQAENATVFTLLERAQAHFILSLEQSEAAQDFVTARRWTAETVAQFGIGFAPAGNVLRKKLSKEDFPTAVRAGLLTEKDTHFYDFFQDRVTFPIHDQRGQLVGFTGRNFSGENPKYLNSRAGGVYDKERILYGYHYAAAAIRKEGIAMLVEGNADVISLHQAGVTNTIARSGTELSAYHIGLIKRLTSKVCIMPDGDKSGLKAAENDVYTFLREGITPHVFELPAKPDGGKTDPDEWCRRLATNPS